LIIGAIGEFDHLPSHGKFGHMGEECLNPALAFRKEISGLGGPGLSRAYYGKCRE
jgi:hypothetical protein